MVRINKTKVLFVCMGNICRSPTADAVFASLIIDQGLSESIECDSAGTHAYHIGHSPDSRAQATAKNHGIDLSHLVARKVTTDDFNQFDYIIAMDNDNLSNLKDLQAKCSPTAKARLDLLMSFSSDWSNDEVPDPYYGGDSGFEDVFKMITDASKGLLNHIFQ